MLLCLRFLKTENIWPVFLDEWHEETLLGHSADAVHVPAYDFHDEIISRSSLAVELLMDILELAIGNVCVDLGRTDICMAEEHLDRAKIGAIAQ